MFNWKCVPGQKSTCIPTHKPANTNTNTVSYTCSENLSARSRNTPSSSYTIRYVTENVVKNLRVITVTSHSITISFDSVGDALTVYTVNAVKADKTTKIYTFRNTTTYTLTGLMPATTYNIILNAVNYFNASTTINISATTNE
jgi:hypothetical protein